MPAEAMSYNTPEPVATLTFTRQSWAESENCMEVALFPVLVDIGNPPANNAPGLTPKALKPAPTLLKPETARSFSDPADGKILGIKVLLLFCYLFAKLSAYLKEQ
jgi:hypothetical protein